VGNRTLVVASDAGQLERHCMCMEELETAGGYRDIIGLRNCRYETGIVVGSSSGIG
jgi:hypothetical protein